MPNFRNLIDTDNILKKQMCYGNYRTGVVIPIPINRKFKRL